MDGNRSDLTSSGDPVTRISDLRPAREHLASSNAPRSRRISPLKKTLAQVLLARGAVTAAQLSAARKVQRSLARPLGDILRAQNAVSETDLLSALAIHYRLGLTDLQNLRPDPALSKLLPASKAIALEAVPWQRMGGTTVVATAQPAHISSLRDAMPDAERVIFTLAPRAQVLAAQVALYGHALARRAEGQTPARLSCRNWNAGRAMQAMLLVGLCLAMLTLALPTVATVLLFSIAGLIFLSNVGLKALAFATAGRAAQVDSAAPPPATEASPTLLRLPVVSLLIPLFKERDIASSLIENLARLDYPAERLDVILLIEEGDEMTRDAINACTLPPWIRHVAVPKGHPQTKPRALNFGLNFARGSIVGIYDAEDRPEPDQISKVVRKFAETGPEVACLQGRLDYYNSGHNPLARCFTVEYASWFRVVLPGVQRLGLFVPLGGTTLFLRRDVLEKLGAWDAHNVTEDAELGLRLARHGYRTELVETTTFEEANAAVWPWIKQRSRWQKGYLMTWLTAMRQPAQLYRDLGAWRFFGFQVQVLGAVTGFLIAPLLWSLMVKPFGVAHPLDAVLDPIHYAAIGVLMVGSLIMSMGLSFAATRAAHLRKHRGWILLVELYHVLGTIAAWRAFAEMLMRPFFWAKTQHGQFGGSDMSANAPTSQPTDCASSFRRTTKAMDK